MERGLQKCIIKPGTPVILALGKPRQEDGEFGASLRFSEELFSINTKR